MSRTANRIPHRGRLLYAQAVGEYLSLHSRRESLVRRSIVYHPVLTRCGGSLRTPPEMTCPFLTGHGEASCSASSPWLSVSMASNGLPIPLERPVVRV